MTFEVLRENADYEISTEYPYVIRKRANEQIVSEFINSTGYIQLNLSEQVNGRTVRHKYLKHRLIAKQFIENPDDLDYVDHINRNRLDNRIENLRWCSSSENSKNKSSTCGVEYEFFDDIDDEAVAVTDYGTYRFENYYYSPEEDAFYFYNGVKYRRLHINERKNGSLFVNMMNTENKRVQVYLSRFKKLYGFI